MVARKLKENVQDVLNISRFFIGATSLDLARSCSIIECCVKQYVLCYFNGSLIITLDTKSDQHVIRQYVYLVTYEAK